MKIILFRSCILLLIEKELANVQSNSKIVSKTISEVVVSFSQAINKKKENVAVQLLLKVGEIYQVRVMGWANRK